MEETFHLRSLLLHLDPHVTTPPLVPASDIDPHTPTLSFSFMVLFYWTSRAWLIKGIQPITGSRSHNFGDLLHLFCFFFGVKLWCECVIQPRSSCTVRCPLHSWAMEERSEEAGRSNPDGSERWIMRWLVKIWRQRAAFLWSGRSTIR